MPLPWSNKARLVVPTTQVVEQVAPSQPVQVVELPPAAEVLQEIVLPLLDDKISSIEHKNGEQVVDARQEDDEDDEEQGLVQEGGRPEEGDHGGEEDVEEARGS
jgi:hypothetical protein